MTKVRSFRATDLSKQRVLPVSAPVEKSVGDQTAVLIDRLDLPWSDPQGNGVSYHLRNDTRGTMLAESARIGEVVEEKDLVVLMGEPIAG